MGSTMPVVAAVNFWNSVSGSDGRGRVVLLSRDAGRPASSVYVTTWFCCGDGTREPPGALKPPWRVAELRSPVHREDWAINGSEQSMELPRPRGLELSPPGVGEGNCWAWATAARSTAAIRKGLLHILQPSFEAVSRGENERVSCYAKTKAASLSGVRRERSWRSC